MLAPIVRRTLPLALLAGLMSGAAAAQLQGRFFLDKLQFRAGEPVFLNFVLKNAGTDAVRLTTGNIYGCGGFSIDLVAEPSPLNTTCPTYSSTKCLLGGRILEPGAELHDRLLLDYEYDLSAPGVYQLAASRKLSYGPVGERFQPLGPFVAVEDRIVFLVEPADADTLRPVYEPYLAELQSRDEAISHEAARVIASLAPPHLEDTIVGMLASPGIQYLALLGLKRLNTAGSRATLAGFLAATPGYSYDKELAVAYLAEVGDVTTLDSLVTGSDPYLRDAAVAALARMDSQDSPVARVDPCAD